MYRMDDVGNKSAGARVFPKDMSSFAIERPRSNAAGRPSALACWLLTSLIYAATLLAMVRFGKFDAVDSLGVFAVLGVGFSFAAWLLTIGVKPLPYRVLEPEQESVTLLAYLVPLAAFIAYGFSVIHRAIPGEPADSIAILLPN